MNVKRGYRRLAVAVVGSWAAVWASIGAFAAWQQGIWSEILVDASRADRIGELSYASEHAQYYAGLIATSLAGGAFSLPLALAFAIAWWVYRGYPIRSAAIKEQASRSASTPNRLNLRNDSGAHFPKN